MIPKVGPLSDSDIAVLLGEAKPLALGYEGRLVLRDKRGHREQHLEVTGVTGQRYRIILRQSRFNPLDFSVILAYDRAAVTGLFLLRRYNGRSHVHTNPIEGSRFYDFHIHTATERYQSLGMPEETFAEPTDRYATLADAIDCLIEDCGFILPVGSQVPIWRSGS